MFLLKERSKKLIEKLEDMIYVKPQHLESYKVKHTTKRYLDVINLDVSTWDEFDCSKIWGGDNEYFWFAVTVTIPESFDGTCVVYELKTGKEGEWDATNPQFLAYVNGYICQGLDVNHREIMLSECATAGESYQIILSAFTGDSNFDLTMDSYIRILDRTIEQYYYDIKIPYETARLLSEDSEEYYTIMKHLTNSLNLVDFRQKYSEEFYQSIEKADEYIQKEFYEMEGTREKPEVYCVGHTHIDVAWLWTLAVTRDKAVRSFSTVLNYMKEYPEYIFMSSQPQLYKYVKETAPKVYETIKEMVKQGRWEAEGAAFVEPDCNLTSGESLIRQILYGKQFFKDEFNVDSKILWLPDVFGYSAALPQIMKKCGIDYFMTTKISWNEVNKMPYDTFEWEGIDGTKILTHFISTQDYQAKAVEGGAETEHFTTYNGHLNPSQVKGCWNRYSQRYLNEEVLMSYGWGDGGGGPTKEMIETQRRLEKGIPGCPKTRQSTAMQFFKTLEERTKNNKETPSWVGELYLEYHRGTYTSMARNKKYNRRGEYLLTNTEFLRVFAKEKLSLAYPKEKLYDMWEILMRNQFHDILPGSSIHEVYEESKLEYEKLFQNTTSMEQEALQALSFSIDTKQGNIIVYNPNSFVAADFIYLSCEDVGDEKSVTDGRRIFPIQKISDTQMLSYVTEVPAKGYKTIWFTQVYALVDNVKMSKHEVETPYLKAELDSNGHFIRIYDKMEHREIIKTGEKANVIRSFEDCPHNFDAWDINNYYVEKSWDVDQVESICVIEQGPVRYSLRIERKYLESTIIQDIYFYPNLCRIDIKNSIDWKQEQILLRDYFPLNIHANEATYEIQYGNVTRPTHYNTSWDFARFEVCAHKWLDLSEHGYGVSILNDCKYGCDVHDGVIGLSMLKSAIYPNPTADKEQHEFTYSILPHKNGWREAKTVQKAYLLNNPLIAEKKTNQGGTLNDEDSLISVNVDNVIVEAIKCAEDGDGIVIRLYEYFNQTTDVEISLGVETAEAFTCDMLEHIQDEIPVDHYQTIRISMKPYEIKTIKIRTLEKIE